MSEVACDVNFVLELELGRHNEELGVGAEHTDLHDDLHALFLKLNGRALNEDTIFDDLYDSTQQ